MGNNRLEKYEIIKLNRLDIHGTDYNPRSISKDASKKLRKSLRDFGMLQPVIVNKNTMNIVSGHQRVDAMDTLLRKNDYNLTCIMVDMSETNEVKCNIVMNNTSIMGEFDLDLLSDIKSNFDIDFEIDLGFDKADLNFMFSESEGAIGIQNMFNSEAVLKDKKVLEEVGDIDKLKQSKREYRDKINKENKNGETYQVKDDDYIISFVFNNNAEKYDFMKRINKKSNERFLKYAVLYDIYKGKYRLEG